MSPLRIVYCAHSLRSDWNNGNAHFLRGLLRGLGALGHAVTAFEPADGWSYLNLLAEGERGERSLLQFARVYPDLDVRAYTELAPVLADADLVLVHEWTEPAVVEAVLAARARHGFKALFHDTHHRASSSPGQIERFRVAEFDGILAFGASLARVYRERWGACKVWTLHEAADTSVFHPHPETTPEHDLVWVGNWGDGERARELDEFLLGPAQGLQDPLVYGVRYPPEALAALARAGIAYGGYLANLDAPAAFAGARATVHVPRGPYAAQLPGIPTIRVFEALACGIPLVSAPWEDSENLFCPHDFAWARTGEEMRAALSDLLRDPRAGAQRAAQGLQTIRARHTTAHRAAELSAIFEEVLA